MKKKLLAGLVIGLFLAGTASISNAALFYFNDRDAFNSAAGFLSFESFEDINRSVASAFTFAGFTVSETGGTNALTSAFNSSFGSNSVTDGRNAIWYDDNGNSIGNFFSFTDPINAFGLDITTDLFSTMTVGGSANTSFSLSAELPTFWGVIDDTNMLGNITFSASGGPLVGFDAVSYGVVTNAEPVPEPATILLFATGILGFVGYRKKLQKNQS